MERATATPDLEVLLDLDRRWARGVGRRVRGKLAEHEKSQTEAAAVLGLAQQGVSRRLRGLTSFTVPELARIAFWLRVPLVDLLPPECAVRDSNPEPADYGLAAA